MKLEKIAYSQFGGRPREWKLEPLEFEDTNLLVGKNASGKSKTLSVIHNLARMLSGELQAVFQTGNYDATFDLNGKKLQYILEYEEAKIVNERFLSDGRAMLTRGKGGVGTLWAEKANCEIEFQTPENQLAALARRDSIQHAYFEPLYEWAKSVYHFPFGTSLGKDKFAMFVKDASRKSEPKKADEVVGVFKKGEKEIGQPFVDSIKQGMSEVGYPLDEVGIKPPISVVISLEIDDIPGIPKDVFGLYVKERNLGEITDQFDMSQGMFRALAVIVHITYAEMVSHPSCVLIDDIGEGLDFDRSSALIELLIKRANASKIQLIMSTNDRFIMNKVPLKTWTVLQREGSHLRAYNYRNSKPLFDQFEITGLNNFDFFSMDFVKQPVQSK